MPKVYLWQSWLTSSLSSELMRGPHLVRSPELTIPVGKLSSYRRWSGADTRCSCFGRSWDKRWSRSWYLGWRCRKMSNLYGTKFRTVNLAQWHVLKSEKRLHDILWVILSIKIIVTKIFEHQPIEIRKAVMCRAITDNWCTGCEHLP